jgi:hypothetical protein
VIARTLLRALWVTVVFLLSAAVALIVLFALGAVWVGDELRAAAPHDPMLRHGADRAFGLVFFVGTVAPALTVLPALAAVVAGEVLRLRSLMYWILAGGASLAAIPLLAGAPPEPSLPTGQYMAIFAAAGFAGGFVYWLLAGARA